MKNLKKILSLVLALAMALSLMTVAFAKDTGDFADGDDVTYAEAVDVMSTIGVFNGVGDGTNFDPNGKLTREQAAKIITYMVMGQTQADQLVATIAPFADVSADRWSAGAIAYCASEGIMNGTGSGKFNPTGELTGLQFAKMLLVALGYDADIEEMTGTAWGLATSKLAYDVKLNTGLDNVNLTTVLTREQAAQMALTAMKTPLVRYPDKGSTISVNGAVVSFGAREAEYVTSEIAKEQTISDQRLSNTKYYTIEFGEKYCPKLVLKHDQDVFGRPDYTWSYDKKKINSYVDYTDLVGEFTAKVTGKDLFELITKTILDDGDVEVYIDGVTDKEIDSSIFAKGNIVKTNTDGVGATGNGTLTQVFVDTSGERNDITIVIINTYLAQAAEDYNEKDEDIDLEVYGVDNVKDNKNPIYVKNVDKANPYETIGVKNEDFDVADMKEDDIVLVRVADGAVQEILTPEVVADATITNFKVDKYVTADGTKYDHASAALYDVEVLEGYDLKNMKDVTYNVILDPYGYLIGIEQNKDPDQYVFITGRQAGSNDLGHANADMRAIFMDGTMDVITVDTKNSDSITGGAFVNSWFKYSVDKNNIYTLKAIPNKLDATNKVKVAQWAQNANGATNNEFIIDKKHVSLNASSDGTASDRKVYGNDDTVYLGVSLSIIGNASELADQATATGVAAKYFTIGGAATKNAAIIDDVESVTVGVKNASLTAKDVTKTLLDTNLTELAMPLSEVYTLYKDNGYVIAAVVIGEDDGVSSNYAYITGSNYSSEGYNATDDEWSWSLEAIVNGEKVELTEVGSGIKYLDEMNRGQWYEVKYDANGNVRGYKNITWQAADDSATTVNPGKYIEEVIDVEPSVDAHDTVLMMADYTSTTGVLTYKNGTLYTDKAQTEGFSVSPNVKAVVAKALLKKDGTVAEFDEVTDGYTDYKGLEKAIRDLDTNFKGDLSVLFEDGVATVIVLNDVTGTSVDTGEEPDVEGIFDTVYDGEETIYIYYKGAVPSKIAQINAIIDELESLTGIDHVENVTLDTSTGDFTADVVRANGSGATLAGTVILATAKMDNSGMGDVIDELENQETDPYKFGGNVTMDAATHTVTFTGAYGTTGTDSIVTNVSGPGNGVTLLDDIARFLGSLYRQMGVRAIEFNGTDYTWDEAGTLKGSNWKDSATPTPGTLVGAIQTASAAAIAGNQNTIDGVSFTMELDGVTWTVKIKLSA